MKRIVGLLVILAAATLIGVALRADNGYALFSYRGTTIEMSLVALAFFIIVGFAVVYLLVRLAIRLTRLPRGVGERRRLQRQRRAGEALMDGLIDVAEGRWEKGEREIVRAAGPGDTALLSYLLAARAAQLQGAHERRDDYLHKAYELTPKARIAVLLTQAELQIAHRQFELALATLRRIQELNPRHAYALRLLARLYEELGDYDQLHALLPSLRSHRALPADSIDPIELRTSTTLMARTAARGDRDLLDAHWKDLSKHLRGDPAAVRTYAAGLIRVGGAEDADEFIRAQLKSQWDEELARLYGLIKSDDPGRQLARGEALLKHHGDSPTLLLSVARFAITCELWGKAKTYLENSLAHGKSADAYAELGALLESLGEPAAAIETLKDGLALTREQTRPVQHALPAAKTSGSSQFP